MVARADRDMDWSDVRVFLALARERRLGAAARQLGQSQPTMGRRLRALEHAIGSTLFQRTGDGLVLTDEGSAILPHAEKIEHEMLALQRRLAGGEGQFDGQLRLSSSDWFGAHLLAPVIAEFIRMHPTVSVELITCTEHLSLSRREADMVFRIRPIVEAEAISRRLMHMPYAAYLREDLAPPQRGDGRGTALITLDTALSDMEDAAWLKETLPNAHVASRSNNRDVQAVLCAQGAGLAVLPTPLGDTLRGVRRVDLGEEPPSRTTWVGFHRDLRNLPRLRALLDLVVERLGN